MVGENVDNVIGCPTLSEVVDFGLLVFLFGCLVGVMTEKITTIFLSIVVWAMRSFFPPIFHLQMSSKVTPNKKGQVFNCSMLGLC